MITLTIEAENARHSSFQSALQLRHGLMTDSVNQAAHSRLWVVS